MKILFSDALRFLTQKNPIAPCPFCKTDQWVVPFADVHNTEVFLTPLTITYGSEQAYNLALECANCGFVREHRAKFIADWIAANPEPEKK